MRHIIEDLFRVVQVLQQPGTSKSSYGDSGSRLQTLGHIKRWYDDIEE